MIHELLLCEVIVTHTTPITHVVVIAGSLVYICFITTDALRHLFLRHVLVYVVRGIVTLLRIMMVDALRRAIFMVVYVGMLRNCKSMYN